MGEIREIGVMKAVLCPVCNGRGALPPRGECADYHETPCCGCGGKGWVEVGEDSPYPAEAYEHTPFVETKCPACGGDRSFPGLASCPFGSHYG